MFAHQERGKEKEEMGAGKRGNGGSANITNGERPTEENEIDPEQEWGEEGPERLEGNWDVNYTGIGNGSLSDLDLEAVGNYGEYSEVEQFLRNNEAAQGFEELRSPTDVEVFRIFANGKFYARGRAKSREILANSARNWPGLLRGAIVFV